MFYTKLLLNRLFFIISLLILWIGFCNTTSVYAIATNSKVYQLVEPFLIVPYFDSARHTSYMDNDIITTGAYINNGQVVLADNRIIPSANGRCLDEKGNERPSVYHERPSNQGDCIWYDGHSGHDFGLAYMPILAAASGRIVRAYWYNDDNRDSDLGLRIEIEHENGYRTVYAHLSSALQVGTTVEQGQIIGTSGNTGSSTGPHLHFEVLDHDGIYVDPFNPSAYLWEEGAWVNDQTWDQWQGRPQESYDDGIIYTVDNVQAEGDAADDSGFIKGRTDGALLLPCPPHDCLRWTYNGDTTLGYENDVHWTFVGDRQDYWATWTPPSGGEFLVEAFIPKLGENRMAWASKYCPLMAFINSPSPNNCIILDQEGSQGHWITLGKFGLGDYPAGTWSGIWQDDENQLNGNKDSGRQVSVDALRFSRVRPDYAWSQWGDVRWSGTGPDYICEGESVNVHFNFQNIGSESWQWGEKDVILSFQVESSSSWPLGQAQAASTDQTIIAPDTIGRATLQIYAEDVGNAGSRKKVTFDMYLNGVPFQELEGNQYNLPYSEHIEIRECNFDQAIYLPLIQNNSASSANQ